MLHIASSVHKECISQAEVQMLVLVLASGTIPIETQFIILNNVIFNSKMNY